MYGSVAQPSGLGRGSGKDFDFGSPGTPSGVLKRWIVRQLCLKAVIYLLFSSRNALNQSISMSTFKSLHFVLIFCQAQKIVYYSDRLFVLRFLARFLPVATVRSPRNRLRIKVFATVVFYHRKIQNHQGSYKLIWLVQDQKRSVREVNSFCGLNAVKVPSWKG